MLDLTPEELQDRIKRTNAWAKSDEGIEQLKALAERTNEFAEELKKQSQISDEDWRRPMTI